MDEFAGKPASFLVQRYNWGQKIDEQYNAPAQALDLWHRLKREGYAHTYQTDDMAKWKKNDEVFTFIAIRR